MDALVKLRQAIKDNQAVELITATDTETPTSSIRDATHVRLGGGSAAASYPLDGVTSFTCENEPQTLRAVVFCWLHDKSSIVEYKTACMENQVADFKFLAKAELTTWLGGHSESCKFIQNDAGAGRPETGTATKTPAGPGASAAPRKRRSDDPRVARLAAYEVDSLDHNAALRGTKNIVLKNLVSDAKKFTAQLKRARPARPGTKAAAAAKKQPIIIVSPATTALLSLSNIKEFLEDGRFVEPALKRAENNVVTVSRPTDRFVRAAQSIMVVDNVDLFTKPEYWDRVIAIFTTGQAWQFAKFKYSRPEVLFQHYQGFYMGYSGDIVPKQIHDWNVTPIAVDRGEKRFRDKMLVRDLWAQLDKTLAAKNYGV